MLIYQETWKNLEFDNLGKIQGKTWNLKNFDKNLEGHGISNKNH